MRHAKFPLHVIPVLMSTEISATTVHVSLDFMMLESINVSCATQVAPLVRVQLLV